MDHLENVNDKTRELILNIEKDMEKMLSSFRLNHCKYVMYKAVELANIYGVDVNKAALAGLTHDIAKEFSREQYMQIAEENNIVFDEYELENEDLMHGKIGAWWVKEHYGFDEDIQKAIELHTVTDIQMNDLAKIIYISDKVEESRKNSNFDIEYERKLSEFEKEHKSQLDEVRALINKARQALQYTTAAGMSAAFQEQYEKANNVRAKRGWLIAAIVFLALSLGIGAWIVAGWGIKDDSTTQLYSLIGRLTMVPFTLLAAIFCANQFVKQKNLAEDYAYKSVLTKSIVAFSEELRDKDEKGYSEYISTVLKEIHQDPLRKRSKEKDEITMRETTGLLGKALDILQSFSSKI